MKWLARKVRRIVVLSLGVVTILLGVVGLFLPVLQGVLLILIGLYLLSRESKIARSWLEKLRERFPNAYENLLRLKEKLKLRWKDDENKPHAVPEDEGG